MPFPMSVWSGSASSASSWSAFWTSPGDPTGMSSPLGRIVILVGLLAALVVTLRWWWNNRRR